MTSDQAASVLNTAEQQSAAEPKPRKKSAGAHRKKNARTKRARQSQSNGRSKTAKILALLKRPNGASLEQLQKATGWQPHSVRGFLSGAIKKKMGLRVRSEKPADGVRTYHVVSK